MSLTYTTYVSALQTMLVINDAEGVALFNGILPDVIDYAELRCYRDLDLLNTVDTSTGAFISGNRSIAIPTDKTFVVIETVNVITPSSATTTNGRRNPLQRISKEFLNAICPDVTATDLPQFYADLDNATLLVGPTPDATYQVEFVGTTRPAPLTVSNSETVLTALFPDMFLSASMIFSTGYQQNFGAAGAGGGGPDNAGMGVNWESIYKTQLASASVEEARKKASSLGWTPFIPIPTALPPRP